MPETPALHCKFLAAAILFFCRLALLFATESGDDWSRRVWQMDDGLPAANVTGIAQTRDGYLWLATQSGLARFDGVQFEIVPIPVGRAQPIIRAMLLDAAGNFWLAEAGGTVVCFGANASRMFSITNGLPNALALQLVETRDRTLWIAYDDGSVFRITPQNKVFRLTTADGLNNDGLASLTLDARGTLWFAKGLQFGFWREGRFEQAGTLSERNAHILGARNGGLWVCTSSQVLKSASNGVPVAVANFPGDTARMKPSVLFEDFNGRCWIGTASEGLFQLEHTNLFKVETSQNKIHAIFRDREGSLWVGTDGGGLNRMFPKTVELRGRDEGLPFETVRSMAEDRYGDLWVVTQDGALTRLPGGDWKLGQPVLDWAGGIAHCVVMDQHGVMWIGTYRRGLYRWQDGKFTRLGLTDGLAGTTIRSLMVDRLKGLWIGLENEPIVQRLYQGQFKSFKQPANTRAVRAMAEDAAGQVWFGTLDGHLLRVDGDKLVAVASPAGDAPHSIRCLSATPDGSLWIGYAVYGVCRLKAGKYSHLGTEQGLFDGNICAMMPDAEGRVWFASDRGIFCAGLDQLNKVADDRASHFQSVFYGRDAGLPSLQAYYGYWPGALETGAGDILLPTHSGIVVVHPDHVRANPVPPKVLIQRVVVDGREIAWQTNASNQFPPDHRKIEIRFTAPSFVAPEQMRFRYRLAGWNEDWGEPASDRAAVFSRLPSGDYTFQVTACNNNGVWNETGAAFAFTVTPFFWQSWPFRLLAALFIMAFMAGVVRHLLLRRVRLLLKRVEQEAALQKERTRIAQDMHDELGARFTQISLLGELSTHALAEPDKARDYLGQISRVARTGIQSLDEIVWAVNPRNDSLSDLLDYTGQYARDFLAAAGLECRLDFPDPMPTANVSGEIRHSVFLVVKEALNNVVKHAQASQVRLSVETTAGGMRWVIEDNGKGFEAAPNNAIADGLRNIRQRSAALRGHADIESVPGKGTRVAVEIPLSK